MKTKLFFGLLLGMAIAFQVSNFEYIEEPIESIAGPIFATPGATGLHPEGKVHR